MLDSETKRRIDTCRDILVGKVPDPKSQVEQITIALIYKFMNDMDIEAEELGGERKYFKGEYDKYTWAKLVASGMGGHEVLALYGEAITKMSENTSIPNYSGIFSRTLICLIATLKPSAASSRKLILSNMTIPKNWGMLLNICFRCWVPRAMQDNSVHRAILLISWWRL